MIRIDRFRPSLRSYRPRKLLGQKPPLKLKDSWAIRIRLQLSGRLRDLALFNLAIDSKLRGCDLVALHVHDVFHSGQVTSRAIIMQQKTGRPVQFEITEQTRVALASWFDRIPVDRAIRYVGSPRWSVTGKPRILTAWFLASGRWAYCVD